MLVKWTVPAYDWSVLPYWSRADTASAIGFPAVVVEPEVAVIARCVAGAATTLTVIGLAPEPTLSEALIVCAPARIKVAEKVP